MSERRFVVEQGGIFDANHVLDASVSTVYNGYALTLATDAELELPSDAGNRIFGLAYEHQGLVELPTTADLSTNLAGKYINVVRGDFQAQVSRLLFEGTTLPTAADTIWSKGDGTLTTTQPSATSGTPTALGYCIGSAQLNNDADIGYSYQTLAKCAFHIDLGGIF